MRTLKARPRRVEQIPIPPFGDSCAIMLSMNKTLVMLTSEADLEFLMWAAQKVEQIREDRGKRLRLAQIPGELERELATIKTRFADPTRRRFTVAVTFRVPEELA